MARRDGGRLDFGGMLFKFFLVLDCFVDGSSGFRFVWI